MNYLKSNSIAIIGLLLLTVFTSCSRDDDNRKSRGNADPIELGSSVTVTNTFQSTAFTNDVELAIEDLFSAPAGSLAATANVGNSVEFPSYLLNLYDIDISEESISFVCVAQEDDLNYGSLFRVLEPNTFDRYYLTFDTAQEVEDFSSSNSSVNLRIDSDFVLVVEIGEGYDFKPGQNFTIDLN
jgi:hypothetical protein